MIRRTTRLESCPTREWTRQTDRARAIASGRACLATRRCHKRRKTKPIWNRSKTLNRKDLSQKLPGRRVENEAKVRESQTSCRGRVATGNLARSLVEARCQWLGPWKAAARRRQKPACRQLDVAPRLLTSTPGLLGAMPTNLHVRAVRLVVLVNAVDDRVLACPLVPVPYSERPYKITLASNGVPAHNQRSGDSIGEVRIVRRGVAVPDGSAKRRRG